MKAQKLPSGSYRVVVYSGIDPVTHKKQYHSFTAPTEWEALKLATEFKERRLTDTRQITVEQAISAYIDSRKDVIAPATLHGYNVIKEWRLRAIQLIPIRKLNKLDIQRSINLDVANGLGWKSCRDSLALLRSACACYGVIIEPTRKFTLPPRKPKKRELPDLRDVLKVILGSSVELPCLLALWAGGMRMSEVRGLQYRDISTSKDGKHFVYINRSRVFVDGEDHVKDTNKTFGSTRKVPLSDYLYSIIQSKPHENETDFIVDESYLAISGRYNRLMKKNNLNLTFHDLRSLFATTLNRSGISKEVLQILGGWNSSKILEEVYLRHSDKELTESLDILSALINQIIDEINAEKSEDKEDSEDEDESETELYGFGSQLVRC